jgi:hypothetical protein
MSRRLSPISSTIEVARSNRSEAEYVDSQYAYLIENKDRGITFEQLRRRRSAEG